MKLTTIENVEQFSLSALSRFHDLTLYSEDRKEEDKMHVSGTYLLDFLALRFKAAPRNI